MKIRNNLNKPVTDHAKQRITERTDISLSDIKKLSKHIYKYGYRLSRFTGDLHTYINSKQIDGGHYSIRVFNNYIYIFDSELKRLLTVYPIPEEYLPVSNYFNTESSPCIIWVRSPEGVSQYISEGVNGSNMLTDDIGRAVEFHTKQKAINYVKNNHMLRVLEKQGYEIIIL